MKIVILGHSGSGKSTLANYLGNLYNIPFLHLDTVFFTSNWKERDAQDAVKMVSDFVHQKSWIIDGNYRGLLQKERIEMADCIIYLNFNRFVCLTRAFTRYFKYRNKTRESMAKGCKEKLDCTFIWWILHKGRTKRKRNYYNKIVNEYSEKSIVIKNQRELDIYMKTVENKHTT